ncbi:MAG TPA: ATP-binding protein, partial [Jatrophihabitantaceae bacterium]|nr:ATP-binding protein [Jatrophihabitantaceae bacterium]
SGKHLLAIINDILDLAKIESGAVQLSLESVDARGVVESVASSLRPLAESKGLELTLALPDDPVVVKSDSRVLGQILINLAGNAIKFTEAGGVHIELGRHVNGRDVPMVAISDTGPGISSDEVANLFSAFERGATVTKRGVEGTGLGLHVSGRLAGLIGSTITVDSTVGEGSTFTLVMTEG